MTTNELTDSQDDSEDADAERLAGTVLSGADRSLGWRDAGYTSALAAARALVGDGHGRVGDRAAEIVAAELAE